MYFLGFSLFFAIFGFFCKFIKNMGQKLRSNICSGVKANMEELEASPNKNFKETLGFLKTILARYHYDMKHIGCLDYFYRRSRLWF
jgi:hypothetical protein